MADQTLALGTKFTAEIKEFLDKVEEIRKQIGKLNSAMIASNKQLKTQAKDFNTYTGSVNKATSAMNRHGQAQKAVGKQISKVEGGLKRLRAAFAVIAAYGIAGGVVGGILLGLREGTKEIVNFDQALRNLEAITGATQSEIAGMGEEILKVARTTKFSTTEVADGMVLLGQAGLSAEEAMSAIQATADLATGTITDFKDTADLLTTTLRAFSLDASQSTRIADVMANAINRSKLTVDKLRTAFNYVGASAAQTGLSLEETAASAMTLANSGLRASTIGTGLRQVLARLLSPSAKLREAFKAHGIQLDKVNPSVVGFEKAIENLAPTMWNAEKGTVSMGKAVELFGLRGAQAAAVLIRGFQSGEFKRMLENVYEVGTAGEMAGIQVEGLALKFKNVADRARNVAVALGDAGIAAALHEVADALKELLGWMEEFIKSTSGQFIVKATMITTALTAMAAAIRLVIGSAAIGGFVSSFTAMTRATGLANAALIKFGFIIRALPILGVAGALGTYVAWMIHARGATRRATEAFQQQSLELRQSFATLTQYHNTLKELEPTSTAYEANVKRLAEAYKDLGTESELLAMSQDELLKKMKEQQRQVYLQSLEASVEAMRKIAKEVDETIQELAKPPVQADGGRRLLQSKKAIEEENKAQAERLKKAKEEFAVSEERKAFVERLKGVYEDYNKIIREAVKTEIESTEAGEDKIKALLHWTDFLGQVANEEMPNYIAALKNATQAETDLIGQLQSDLDKMPAPFREIVDAMNELEMAQFVRDYEAFNNKLAQTEKSLRDRKKFTEDYIQNTLAKMRQKWIEAYDFGGEEKALAFQRKVLAMRASMTEDETLKVKAQFEARKATIKEMVEKRIKEEEALGRSIDDIQKEANRLYIENEQWRDDKLKEIAEKRVQDILDIEKWYQSQRAKLTADETQKVEERFKAEEASLRAAYEKRKTLLEGQEKELADLKRKYDELLKLNAQNRSVALIRIKMNENEKLLDLEEAKNRALIEERKRQAGGDEVELERILDAARELEIEHAQDVLSIRKKYAADIREVELQDKDAIIEADKAVADAQARLSRLRTVDYLLDRRAETDAEIKELRTRLRYIAEFSDEYFEIMERLHKLGDVSDERIKEMRRIQDAKQAGLWASFEHGLDRARENAKDWGDIMIQIGSQIEDTIAGNMTDAILDFAEGAKTAKEAFEDFARSTIRWLGQIIIKQAILNMLQGITTKGGSGYGTRTYTGGEMGYTHHRGGKVGRDGTRRMVDPAMFQFAPRLHKGLRADEFPAILQRGEEVIPKNQTGKPFGDVKVIVNNNSGQQVQASPEGVKWDGSNMIVSVVIDAYQRNKMGLRDMMRSPA